MQSSSHSPQSESPDRSDSIEHLAAPERPLTLLGDLEVATLPETAALHQMIGERLPPVLHRDCNMEAAGAAVLQALGRRLNGSGSGDGTPNPGGRAPHLQITWMIAPAASTGVGGCWSFFVIERPASSPATHDVVELCIYQE